MGIWAQLSVTACNVICGQQIRHWTTFETDWKYLCSMVTSNSAFVASANYGYISKIIVVL